MTPWGILIGRGFHVRYSNHARDRMAERGVTEEEVLEALRFGRQISKRRAIPTVRLDINDVVVVVRLTMRHIQVITVFRDTTGAEDEADEPDLEDGQR